jgi:hypothetical protein
MKIVDSLVNKLKKLIVDFNELLKADGMEVKNELAAWKYVFGTIKFLLSNEFIAKEYYSSFYQDFKILKEVVYYSKNFFEKDYKNFNNYWDINYGPSFLCNIVQQFILWNY